MSPRLADHCGRKGIEHEMKTEGQCVWRAECKSVLRDDKDAERGRGQIYTVLLLFSCSVMSDSLQPHGLQHARLRGKGFPGGSPVKNLPAHAGDEDPIPESGRSPGKGNGNPLHYSCLENSMDRGAWWAIAHGVATKLDTTQQLNKTRDKGPGLNPNSSGRQPLTNFRQKGIYIWRRSIY